MPKCDLCGLPASKVTPMTTSKGETYDVCSTCCVDFHETMEFLEHGQFILAKNREPSFEATKPSNVPSGGRSDSSHR